LKKVFDEIDVDGSGFIDKKELAEFMNRFAD